ncbi:MAG: hypothetical protein RLZZ505_1061 [Verrucomicrobiota bacterium]|jgi:hypothetical protein
MKTKSSMIRSAGLHWIAAAGFALGSLTANAAEIADLDGDGIPNMVDPDIDSDGIPNALDDNIDGGIAKSGPFAGQYLGDHINNDNPAEKDIDDDGQADDSLGETDLDADSKTDDNPSESDIDGDRREDDMPSELDLDGDGRNDDSLGEDDIDGDSLDDDDLMEDNIDGDSLNDLNDDDIDGDHRGNSGNLDDDTDGDGLVNADDKDDSDGDNLSNRDDDDDDNDGDTDEDDVDHHGEDDEIEVQISLTPTVNAPNGSRCRVKIQRMATGKIEMDIDGRDFGTGSFTVVLDGNPIGQLTMQGDAEKNDGEVEFETNANGADEVNLTIDPIGLPIQLVKAGQVYFTGIVPTPPDAPAGGDDQGNDNGGGASVTAGLTPEPGLGSEASAEVQIQFGVAGAAGFEIEAEAIPEGAYQIKVGGILRGTLVVALVDGKTYGKLRFEVIPDGAGELLLDFPVAGETVAIMKDGVSYFSGTVPTMP